MAATLNNLTMKWQSDTVILNRISNFAKAGVGRIITGGIGVHNSGRSSEGSAFISTDSRIDDLSGRPEKCTEMKAK